MPADASSITIIVETPSGAVVRSVRPATLLPEGAARGPAAEAATRGAAAAYGLPDFVFHPATERRGPGVREIGDALLITGRRGLAIQVKARQAVSGDPDRERSWLEQKAAEGTRQALGTIRRLRYPVPTLLENLRGSRVSLRGRDVDWVGVVVLDHPGAADLVLGGDAVVVSRQDWEFLFEQMQSSVAVVEYFHRVASEAASEFGRESLRYYDLAMADAAVPPTPVDAAYGDLPIRNENSPQLPLGPAQRANLIRWVLEDIAEVAADGPDEQAARGRLEMLAAIDRAPIGARDDMAATILGWLERVQEAPGEAVWWRFRHYIYSGRVHLILGVCNQNHEAVREAFGNLVLLRHIERGERNPSDADLPTVGVLLQPTSSRRRPWDTTAVMPVPGATLEPEARAAVERLWSTLDLMGRPPGNDAEDPFADARAAREERLSVRESGPVASD
jgi:hypothetical protein